MIIGVIVCIYLCCCCVSKKGKVNIKMEDVDLEKSDATVEGKCAENQPTAINNFKSKPVKSSTITSASSSVDGEANLRQPQVNGKKNQLSMEREKRIQ